MINKQDTNTHKKVKVSFYLVLFLRPKVIEPSELVRFRLSR